MSTAASGSASLIQRINQTIAKAQLAKQLHHMETTIEHISSPSQSGHANNNFVVRCALPGRFLKPSNLEQAAQDQQASAAKAVKKTNTPVPDKIAFNPFKPYDKFTFVEEMAPNHNLCLNKFYVYDHHLLLLTRDFQPQVTHLTVDDFLAVVNTWELVGDGDKQNEQCSWMAFYNRGFYSGASQPHKHIQMVPSHTLADEQAAKVLNFPLIPVLDKHIAEQDNIQQVPEYIFKHAFGSVKQCKPSIAKENDAEYKLAYAKNLHAKYLELLQRVGLLQEQFAHNEAELGDEIFIQVICEDKATYEKLQQENAADSVEKHRLSLSMTKYPSYNLLFTRNWMVIVPRKLENYQNISCNSLCFAFSFFARHDVDLAVLKSLGCSNLLANITFEKK